MKKIKSALLSLALLSCMTTTGIGAVSHAAPPEISPYYVGVSQVYANLDISSLGKASCKGTVYLRSGYTADITVTLKEDGNAIKSWTASGSNTVTAGNAYYVTKGHTYVVTTTALVYNSSGSLVDEISQDSNKISY